MIQPNDKYGMLLNKNILLHRKWFKEMCSLIGIKALYYAPKKPLKDYDINGDLFSKYELPEMVGIIMQDHPDQKTLKKIGWVAELQEGSSIIHVPYDLKGLEEGALFMLPSGLDDGKGRVFRVISMQNIMTYPASIACEIAPEYEDTAQQNEVKDFSQENFTVLADNEGDD